MNEPAPTSRNLPIPHGDLRFCVIGASSFLGAAVDALLQAGLRVVSIASQSLLDQPDGPIETYLATKGLHESLGGIVSRLRLPFVHTSNPNDAAAIAAIKQTGANAVLSVSAPIIRIDAVQYAELSADHDVPPSITIAPVEMKLLSPTTVFPITRLPPNMTTPRPKAG